MVKLEKNIIYPLQKGFRESDECVKHNFLIQTLIDVAKTQSRGIHMAWLDLENTFGAVPHSIIFEALQKTSLPTPILNIIKSLYDNARCKILTSDPHYMLDNS